MFFLFEKAQNALCIFVEVVSYHTYNLDENNSGESNYFDEDKDYSNPSDDVQRPNRNTAKNQIILTIGDTRAVVFGEMRYNDVPPILRRDRTMLPARFVAESLGAWVDWDEYTERITITRR